MISKPHTDSSKWLRDMIYEYRARIRDLEEQLETLRFALGEIADMPVEESARNGWSREMQSIARAALNPAKRPE